MLSFLAQDFFSPACTLFWRSLPSLPHSYARSGNPLSLASFSTVWLRLSHRMPRQTPSDDSLANRNSAGRSFCSTILLSFSGRSYVAFRRRLFCWSVCELNIICPFRFLLKFLLSNCYVIAMSCDLLLCPCYVIALRMLCFLLCVNYLLQTTGTIPTVHLRTKWGHFSQVYTVACQRKFPL